MKQPAYQRNQEGKTVVYDVRSEHTSIYYQVEMLGEHAVSCNCAQFVKGHKACKHMEIAEEAEKSNSKVTYSQPGGFHLDAPLNGNRGFLFNR